MEPQAQQPSKGSQSARPQGAAMTGSSMNSASQGQRIISDFRPASGQPALSTRPPQITTAPPLGTDVPIMAPNQYARPPSPQTPPMQDLATIREPATPLRSTGHTSFTKPELPDIEPRETPKQTSAWHDILSIFGVLASALLLAFILISFVFQSYQVDGPSMQTTLENNDHLIVWKVSKTIANITGNDYIPNRGDVVIFNEPGLDGGSEDKQLIKRVLALPGERVVVKDNIVTVFNDNNPNGFQPDKTLPYGEVITTTPGNVDVTVGEGQVFVCGDNRSNSLDSRVFGPVSSEQIIGKLVLRVLPLNTVKLF